ncbi:unnamed protein product [Dovyalis caffra]|uniref:Secreted protein n=1 Tax=Dovyalis caffra TaxID=77055 RepID=A0AAV1QT00_9ROSI|nr:unnamed protein product [Dovyalis caffra]
MLPYVLDLRRVAVRPTSTACVELARSWLMYLFIYALSRRGLVSVVQPNPTFLAPHLLSAKPGTAGSCWPSFPLLLSCGLLLARLG